LKIVSLGATLAAILGGVWYAQAHHAVEPPPAVSMTVSAPKSPVLGPVSRDEAPANVPKSVTPMVAEDMASAFKHTTDYAEFTRKIRAQAESGNAEAQFYMEEALHYCDDEILRFFYRGAKQRLRTLDEALANEARIGLGKHPEKLLDQVTEVYNRCHVFLEDSEIRPELKQWTAWLDKASDNGVPAAENLKAALLMRDYNVAQYSRDPAKHADPTSPSKAHELVLNALQSADPRVFWGMADMVSIGADQSQQELERLNVVSTAWQLLACQRGFDCSAQADWLRFYCTTGPVCAPGETGQQFLERAVGDTTRWDKVKQLANEIGAAVDAKDETKLPLYLPGFFK
jgi:hypothetical protein